MNFLSFQSRSIFFLADMERLGLKNWLTMGRRHAFKIKRRMDSCGAGEEREREAQHPSASEFPFFGSTIYTTLHSFPAQELILCWILERECFALHSFGSKILCVYSGGTALKRWRLTRMKADEPSAQRLQHGSALEMDQEEASAKRHAFHSCGAGEEREREAQHPSASEFPFFGHLFQVLHLFLEFGLILDR